MESWGQPCVVAAMEYGPMGEILTNGGRDGLQAVRVAAVPSETWLPVREYERRRRQMGGPGRPGSIVVYLFWAPLGRLLVKPYEPPPAPDFAPTSYADWLDRGRERKHKIGEDT